MEKMTKTKHILIILFILILGIVFYRFEQYKVEKNFLLFGTVECQVEDTSCFVADCSPDVDPECDITLYQKIEVSARNAPACLFEHDCVDFVCEESQGCEVIVCSQDTIDIGESCIEEL